MVKDSVYGILRFTYVGIKTSVCIQKQWKNGQENEKKWYPTKNDGDWMGQRNE